MNSLRATVATRTTPDPTAFEHQALAHFDTLYRAALRLTSNPQDAEDLVQDTYLRAFRFFRQFQPGTNLRAWLLKILTNSHLDSCRSRASAPLLVPLDGQDESKVGLIRALADRQPGVEEQVLSACEAEQLHGAVADLPEQFAVAVRLADLEDRSYDEIAHLTGVGRNTVGSRIFRGRAILREQLATHYRVIHEQNRRGRSE